MQVTERSKPVRVELVGIAGVGKTTLKKSLCLRDRRVCAVTSPSKWAYLPHICTCLCLWLATCLEQYRASRSTMWKGIKLMAYLQAWPRHLRQQQPAQGRAVVLDSGSVYWFAALRIYGIDAGRHRLYARWFQAMLRQWVSLIDVIVWLDAPDEVLLERIYARDRWRIWMDGTREEIIELFALTREHFRHVIDAMTQSDGPMVLRFRTDQQSSEEIAHQVLAALDLQSTESGN